MEYFNCVGLIFIFFPSLHIQDRTPRWIKIWCVYFPGPSYLWAEIKHEKFPALGKIFEGCKMNLSSWITLLFYSKPTVIQIHIQWKIPQNSSTMYSLRIYRLVIFIKFSVCQRLWESFQSEVLILQISEQRPTLFQRMRPNFEIENSFVLGGQL